MSLLVSNPLEGENPIIESKVIRYMNYRYLFYKQ